jgi:hypothetical protein
MSKSEKPVIPNEVESNDIVMKSSVPETKLRNRFEKTLYGANIDSSTSLEMTQTVAAAVYVRRWKEKACENPGAHRALLQTER